MKGQLHEYYQCNGKGYVKLENFNVEHLSTIKEIPVSARCNKILPYQLHKIEIKDPVQVSSDKIITHEEKHVTIQQPQSFRPKKQTLFNYSFSVSSLDNPIKMLQKDEVRSIHIDDKTSARTKIQLGGKDLKKSTFTSLNKQKTDMKRSLFEANQSFYTNDTSNKESQKLDMIVNQLVKEKKKREQFEKKYQILMNMVNKQKNVFSSQNTSVAEEIPTPKYPQHQNKKRNIVVNSYSQSQEQSETETPVIIKYESSKRKRKSSSPSPIIINLGSQILCRSPQLKKSQIQKSDGQLSDLAEIKENLQVIHDEVTMLHENMQFLEKKMDEQETRRQKQALLQELRDKEERLQMMVKQNEKIKQINELLVTKQAQSKQSEKFVNLKFSKSTIIASFIISMVMWLFFLGFRSSICD